MIFTNLIQIGEKMTIIKQNLGTLWGAFTYAAVTRASTPEKIEKALSDLSKLKDT